MAYLTTEALNPKTIEQRLSERTYAYDTIGDAVCVSIDDSSAVHPAMLLALYCVAIITSKHKISVIGSTEKLEVSISGISDFVKTLPKKQLASLSLAASPVNLPIKGNEKYERLFVDPTILASLPDPANVLPGCFHSGDDFTTSSIPRLFMMAALCLEYMHDASVAAMIVDVNGAIVSWATKRYGETGYKHAEVKAVLQLLGPLPNGEAAVFSTLKPCLMCASVLYSLQKSPAIIPKYYARDDLSHAANCTGELAANSYPLGSRIEQSGVKGVRLDARLLLADVNRTLCESLGLEKPTQQMAGHSEAAGKYLFSDLFTQLWQRHTEQQKGTEGIGLIEFISTQKESQSLRIVGVQTFTSKLTRTNDDRAFRELAITKGAETPEEITTNVEHWANSRKDELESLKQMAGQNEKLNKTVTEYQTQLDELSKIVTDGPANKSSQQKRKFIATVANKISEVCKTRDIVRRQMKRNKVARVTAYLKYFLAMAHLKCDGKRKDTINRETPKFAEMLRAQQRQTHTSS